MMITHRSDLSKTQEMPAVTDADIRAYNDYCERHLNLLTQVEEAATIAEYRRGLSRTRTDLQATGA
jgi:hypothetical protein